MRKSGGLESGFAERSSERRNFYIVLATKQKSCNFFAEPNISGKASPRKAVQLEENGIACGNVSEQKDRLSLHAYDTRVATNLISYNLFLFSRVSLGALAPGAL